MQQVEEAPLRFVRLDADALAAYCEELFDNTCIGLAIAGEEESVVSGGIQAAGPALTTSARQLFTLYSGQALGLQVSTQLMLPSARQSGVPCKIPKDWWAQIQTLAWCFCLRLLPRLRERGIPKG